MIRAFRKDGSLLTRFTLRTHDDDRSVSGSSTLKNHLPITKFYQKYQISVCEHIVQKNLSNFWVKSTSHWASGNSPGSCKKVPELRLNRFFLFFSHKKPTQIFELIKIVSKYLDISNCVFTMNSSSEKKIVFWSFIGQDFICRGEKFHLSQSSYSSFIKKIPSFR